MSASGSSAASAAQPASGSGSGFCAFRARRLSRTPDVSAATVPDMEHLHDIAVDRKQDPVDVLAATVDQLVYFNR
jgi:hypothetical protein